MKPVAVKLVGAISEPFAEPWKYGHLVSTIVKGDRTYGVVITEHNEFETALLSSLVAMNGWNKSND